MKFRNGALFLTQSGRKRVWKTFLWEIVVKSGESLYFYC